MTNCVIVICCNFFALMYLPNVINRGQTISTFKNIYVFLSIHGFIFCFLPTVYKLPDYPSYSSKHILSNKSINPFTLVEN